MAGDLAVRMLDKFLATGLLSPEGEVPTTGRAELGRRGIDVDGLAQEKRPVCRFCLDWSERRNHLAGSLGAAIFGHFERQGWASRRAGSRVVHFAPDGEARIERWYSHG